MLPSGVGQRFLLSENPLVSGFLPASRTEPALATEANLFLVATIWIATAMVSMAHDLKPTAQHFDDVFNDCIAERVSVFGKITPPSLVGLK